MIDLAGKVALVTGGHVGTQLARAILKEGATVALVFRNPSREQAIRAEFSDVTGSLQAVRADLSSYNEARAVVDRVTSSLGGIDFVLNSLGGWIGGMKLHEHSSDDLHHMLDMDLIPTFNLMSAVLPKMVEQKSGKIVNFISMQVFGSGKGNSLYTASKSAILALTNAAAAEYKDSGISIYAVAPSTIDTDANRKSMPDADFSKWVPVGEIIETIVYLCKSGNSMSGSILKFAGQIL